MKRKGPGCRGQSLLETALLLPLLLILLAGGTWSFRNLSFSGGAESAAHAHLLRTGRGLPSIATPLSRTIHPGDDTVTLTDGSAPLAASLPLFGGLTGNSLASASVACTKEPAGAFIELPDHGVRRGAEGAVDCWGDGTRSGSKIRGVVRAVVAAGVAR